MHITITGDLGSGKSTLCEKLKVHNKFEVYSTGKIQREIAKEYGMTTLEFNEYTMKNPNIDHEIDNQVSKVANDKKSENLIFDSRMAWNFVPKSLKIYLTVRSDIAAKRVFDVDRGNVESYSSIKEAEEKLLERRKLEVERFYKIYHVICNDYKHFDLVIDTTFASADEVYKTVLYIIKQYKKNLSFPKFWVCSKNLYPTQFVREMNAEKLFQYQNEFKNKEASFQPIEGFEYNGTFHILNGHHRVSACLYNNLNLIPFTLSKKMPFDLNPQEFLSSISTSVYYDWEELNKFSFLKYSF